GFSRDWSSGVCSSDLVDLLERAAVVPTVAVAERDDDVDRALGRQRVRFVDDVLDLPGGRHRDLERLDHGGDGAEHLGLALHPGGGRERVVWGESGCRW